MFGRLVARRGLLALIVGGAAALSPTAASAAPFQRGDLFGPDNGVISEYSPTGAFVQSFSAPNGVGGGSMCFTPNARRLIVVGIGLFDDSGHLLASKWSSVTGGRCVVDGSGHVYVFQGDAIGKFDVAGDLLASFPFVPSSHTDTMDLAPDECTMLIGGYAATGQGQVNVCTGVASGSAYFADQMLYLPDWSILSTQDVDAILTTPSGQSRYYYQALGGVDNAVYSLLLDPDGRTFWSCCWKSPQPGGGWGPPLLTLRWDLETGKILWRGSVPTSAIYGPPLVGNANVARTVDSNAGGTAEAFRTQARFSGQMDRLHLWVDSTSTASQAILGLYNDVNGHPGRLLAHGTVTSIRAGSWNYVDLPATGITAGQRYWIAVLASKGPGTLAVRDTNGGGRSETSAQANLSALPSHWSSGASWSSAPLSAYGS